MGVSWCLLKVVASFTPTSNIFVHVLVVLVNGSILWGSAGGREAMLEQLQDFAIPEF